ncbi:hypothetical protein Patl1_18153 [Pistacia atlantica]|uniref:Uncharacterized protein n=1 Tax=Pistacia atlantica TaxID=434234 RepID=A0ACC1C0W5_9ROSI|nr:hypothetical protein Patl1_18153 [Pistacia atlantica]
MDQLILLHQWWQELNQTTPLSTILTSLIVFSFFLLYLFNLIRSKGLNFPPSPPKLPIIGNLHQIGARLHHSLRNLSEKYGPIMLLHLGHSPVLIVSSAEIGKEIFLKTHDAFLYRPQSRAARALFYGCCDIAFCPFGDYWRQVRKICVEELLNQSRVQAFQLVREVEVVNMVEKIRLVSLTGDAVNFTQMFATISNNIIIRSAIGRVYEEENSKSFSELSRSAMDLLGYFCFEDLIPILGWMDNLTGLTAKLKTTSGEICKFLDQVIEKREALKSSDDKSDEKDLLDILLHLQKDGNLDNNLTRENIKAILLDMFVGGTDNTATTLEWAMAELVKNPSVMRKTQEEVRRVVGKKSKVEENDVNQMVYLKWVVKETMRLHVPAMITRATIGSTKLEGYDIPPKAIVLINAWAIQRDPKLWDRPEEFVPERFANISVDFTGQHSQFIPFGAGRRSCPGISLQPQKQSLC